MGRRKYRFKSRAEAEEAYQVADRGKLLAEWFASALLKQSYTLVRTVTYNGAITDVGYYNTRSTSVVFATYVPQRPEDPHCIRGLWDSDSEQFRNVVAALMRDEETHDFGRALDEARAAAWAADRASVA